MYPFPHLPFPLKVSHVIELVIMEMMADLIPAYSVLERLLYDTYIQRTGGAII
jgi:hypothetical protein